MLPCCLAKMTKLATKEFKDFEVSDIDKRANTGNSYSFNTVKKFIEEFGSNIKNKKLNFLIGADAFANFDKWFKFKELASLVKFIVVTRNGEIRPDITAKKLKQIIPDIEYQIFNENFDISSTKLSLLMKLANVCIYKLESVHPYLPLLHLSHFSKMNLYQKLK